MSANSSLLDNLSIPQEQLAEFAQTAWREALAEHPNDPENATTACLVCIRDELIRKHAQPTFGEEFTYSDCWMSEECGDICIETAEDAAQEMAELLLEIDRMWVAPFRDAGTTPFKGATASAQAVAERYAQDLAEQCETPLDDAPELVLRVVREFISEASASSGCSESIEWVHETPAPYEIEQLREIVQQSEPSESPITDVDHLWFSDADSELDSKRGLWVRHTYHPASQATAVIMAELWVRERLRR